jgi:hypothetical protein
MAQKLYNIKFVVTNMTKIVVNDSQLRSDYLQTRRFLVVVCTIFKKLDEIHRYALRNIEMI